MLRKAFVTIAVALLWSTVTVADLTGEWRSDDGGRYYLRQIGNTLYWYGERSASDPQWSNVYDGRVQGDQIRGQWADVPKGKTSNWGQLRLRVQENGNVLMAVHKTGGLGGSRWTRAGYTPPPVAAVQEHCLSFDPANAAVKFTHGQWKIVDGDHWLFDFGSAQSEARQAHRIIKHYRMNRSCFVGRPNPSFSYTLVSRSAPTGSVSGEDCLSFNTKNLRVESVAGHWRIVEGNHTLFDFGNQENEARQSFGIINKHSFTQSCFVGRTRPSFQYLRR